MNRMKKVVLLSSAVLICYGTAALATVGNPTQSVLRNEQVQNTLEQTHGKYSKEVWEHMSDSQKAAAKQKENERLHKIGAYKVQEHSGSAHQGGSTSENTQ